MHKFKIYYLDAIAFVLYFTLLMTKARLRLDNTSEFHFGGAEYAIAPFDIAFVLIIIIIIIKIYFSEFKIAKDKLNLIAGLYILINIASILTSSDREFTFYELVRQVKFFIIYLWLRSVFSNSKGKKLLYVSSCFAILVQLFFVYLQYLTGTTTSGINNEEVELNKIAGGLVRTVGTFGHPGLLGQYLNIILTIILVKTLMTDGLQKKIYATMYLMGTLAVILTYSRTALAIQMATLILILYLAPSRETSKNISKKLITYISVFFGFITVIAMNYESIIGRFENASVDSGEVRILLSKIALNMIAENPITGVGLNAFTQTMDRYDSSMMSSYWRHPVHNIYLLVAAEIGLIGVLIFLAKLYIFFKVGIKTLRDRKTPDLIDKEFSLIGVVGLSVICLSGFLGWSWRLDAIQGLYWTLLAVIACTYKRPRFLRAKPIRASKP
ncbi:hypothetical protein AQS70_17720 [Pseudomonas endophytica]|uniref:O-antigen ligase-related domain-containing protein n=1 Tax=Pseudomonas endophytica TaxID=1563157 RepID=A0A0Q0SJG3_9PSED|nr:O-antigen ligase family protein [Pseudomonas endophytica]KQB51557.1 hypothetical protein AQS70_17720 [Pseudomonas endophytica]